MIALTEQIDIPAPPAGAGHRARAAGLPGAAGGPR